MAASAPFLSSLRRPPRKYVGIDIAEDDVGVGDRHLGAAHAVTDRSGVGAGAVRTDQQAAGHRIDPGDGAAAGADRFDVDHRLEQAEPLDDRLAGIAEVVVGEQADVEARAAHVGGDDVGVRRAAGDHVGGDHAAGRPRLQGADAGHLLGPDDAAVRLHHHDVVLEAGLLELAVQARDVTVDGAPQEAVGDRGVGAGEFAHLRRNAMRQGDRQRAVGIELAGDLGHRVLVRRVHPAEQEADGDGVDALMVDQFA